MNFGTLLDFLLVVFGFTMIVVIHEFGHFAAARWAGVRVLAFAVGFGRAVCSYRKGLGLRRGSSEGEYMKLARTGGSKGVSPTEYRLNMLPFGGYVKMLGQDDLDPGAVSNAPDSYQMCKPWKRMVIISAGVVMNAITAMIMFVIVFGAGLNVDAPVLGYVEPGSPAAKAKSLEAGIPDGLRPGDRIARIDGDLIRSQNDIIVAAAFTGRGDSMRFEVLRDGDSSPRYFDVSPEIDDATHLMNIGVDRAASVVVKSPRRSEDTEKFRNDLAMVGLPGVEPGMKLIGAGGRTDLRTAGEMEEAFAASGGAPVPLTFADSSGKKVTVDVQPLAQLSPGEIRLDKRTRQLLEHVAGLVPLFRIGKLDKENGSAFKAGLQEGDLIAKLNDVEYPSAFQGVSEIRAAAGKDVSITVLRKNEVGEYRRVEFSSVPVSGEGRIGIYVTTAASESAIVATNPPEYFDENGEEIKLPQNPLIGVKPCNIVSVNGKLVASLVDVRNELQRATLPIMRGEVERVDVDIMAIPLDTPGEPAPTTITMSFDRTRAELLHRLSHTSPFGSGPFEALETTLKAANPAEAISMGFAETHRQMLQVYLTFRGLFQGTVQVRDLKGPVGIAHVGTLIASKGWVWLLFFCALISVNLAVMNFLPLPIVDGGQLLLIIYEQIVGRPASVAFQNAVAIAGLVLFGSLFLFITFHDIRNLFGL